MRKINKLVFVPVELIQASLIFVSKAEAYPSVAAYNALLYGYTVSA